MLQHRLKMSAERRIAPVRSLVLWTATTAVAAGEGSDPEADRILRSMSTDVGALTAFSVAADIDGAVIDLAGQKLQLSGSGTLAVGGPIRA
ncbi:MAG: hypothetical protein WAM94_13290 [Chromatiaceae bacterium]